MGAARQPGAFVVDWPTPPAEIPRLRIAIVSPELGPGAGVPHYWFALAGALSQHHEVHVFTSKGDGSALDGVQFHHLRAVTGGWLLPHLTFYLSARLRFLGARLARRPKFDLVLGIGALTPFADVTTVHFVQAREILLQRQGAFPREKRPSGVAGMDYALYGHLMGWLGRRFYRRSTKQVVAISQEVKQDLVRFEGARLRSISVVPNGVDCNRFHPDNRGRDRAPTRQSLGVQLGEVVLLFVGNSWGRKGLATAIEAIQGNGVDHVRLIVVGDGVPEPFLSALPPTVRDRIVFVGQKSHDVERYYAAADVFILPTMYEPFGLVALEALACGLPSIISACAGASDWLEDGVDVVLLADPKDGTEAREALRSIITSPLFADRLGQNGRRTAERFQWSRVAREILQAAGAGKPAPDGRVPRGTHILAPGSAPAMTHADQKALPIDNVTRVGT
ncbi:MAG: glycosyltransferase family 4 protein [Hyphomicrobiales bacterium]